MVSTTVTTKRKARDTSVALKIGMAVSGILFVLFILMHMYGNLKMFAGAQAYNDYAEHLRTFGEPILPYEGLLWILRIVLLAALILHAYAAFTLWHRAGQARGSKYAVKRTLAQTYASRTMRWGGVILLLFIIFHILQFTTLSIEIGGDYHSITPYERMVVAFQQWYVWLIYLIAIASLAMHVRHGVWSAMATLGGNKKRRQDTIHLVAIFVAAIVFVGFMLPPTATLFGWVS
ncbi:succinate dehydrogenase [Bowdeniella nasicola]|uniref:Succinate dehydrogenase n=1 Tax=Bowdeniella nasicola TaxID=208480 RepID=A0A1Q5Q5Z5_9ACTO|nr:succinate dehydrogenase cytochrome b subunit [Bowdeniella nasicola]OKL55119.1 succinate dehydrogenase [Bowdeniella nasicola]